MAISKIDTSSISGLGYGFKNRIINGAMMIDQRNAGASVTPTASNLAYGVDRFFTYQTQSSKFTLQQNAGSVTPPSGFTNYLGITSSSAYSVLSTDLFQLVQRIEGYNVADLGWGTVNAQTVTLSFWVRSSLTGTFGGSFGNSANNRSYAFTYTINSANTWEQKSITVTGDQSGTWLTTNGVGIYISFGLGVGSTYSGTAGSWGATNYQSATGATSVVGTSGATFYITGVQLEAGNVATSFDYRPYGTELALCQRYLPAFNANGSTSWRLPAIGINSSTTAAYVTVTFPVTTRVPATGISISSASHFLLDGIASSTPTAITFNAYNGTNANRISLTGMSGLTTGQPCFLDFQNASGQLLFTGCEL